jgi:type I restriction enzyme R subunit
VEQPPSNFAFLAPYHESLARLGALAEWAFHYDPPTTLAKLRLFAEVLAKIVAARHALKILPRENFETVLRLLRDDGALPRQPADLLHYLRRVGNTAVHDNIGTPAEALSALKQARQLGIWFVRAYGKAARFIPAPFQPPEPPQNATGPLHAEISRLRHALAEQQSRAEAEAQTREAEARARETAEQSAAREAEERAVWEALAAEQEAANVALAAQLRALREQAEQAAPSAQAALLQQSERAAEAIELDEADTRLISSMPSFVRWAGRPIQTGCVTRSARDRTQAAPLRSRSGRPKAVLSITRSSLKDNASVSSKPRSSALTFLPS